MCLTARTATTTLVLALVTAAVFRRVACRFAVQSCMIAEVFQIEVDIIEKHEIAPYITKSR